MLKMCHNFQLAQGVTIPFHDFRGKGEILHFAHANAYPPECYQQFLAPFLKHYQVIGIKHRPLWPDSQIKDAKNWQIFADDLIALLEQRQLKKTIAMGHSFGAVITMLAALKRPEMFKRLIFIEPPLLSTPLLFLVNLLPTSLLNKVFPPTRMALRRRDRWDNFQAVFDSYRKKKIFARLSDAALWDFVNHGVRLEDNSVVLVHSKQWEAHLYNTIPLLWSSLRKISHNTLAIRGQQTDLLHDAIWKKWKTVQAKATFVQIPEAGHLVPLEQPLMLAQEIIEYLHKK